MKADPASTLFELLADQDWPALGREMHALATRLYPIPRSITGDGVRRTLSILHQEALGTDLPLEIHEVPTGTEVLDWTVPREWNLREAWIKDPSGQRIVDVAEHSLHLLSYSVPVHRTLPLAELKQHLFSLPEQPELIPYRTSYYQEAWGFCLPHRQLESLPEGDYEVHIDSSLEEGSLTYGELLLPGESKQEILISCHICHPALANDNLSGLGVTALLARLLGELPERRWSYRFLWLPGTIGAITWLARNREWVKERIRGGLVAANLGDPGPFHYKRARRPKGQTEAAEIDRAVEAVLRVRGEGFEVEDFIPFGYDERQYSSPGFTLAVGSLTRTPWGRYPEYHTSADDLGFITPEALAESLRTYLAVAGALEANRRHRNLQPYGEPQLGKRGLYGAIGGSTGGSNEGTGSGTDARTRQLALLWMLNLSDGEHDLLDIAERSGMAIPTLLEAARALRAAHLLEPIEQSDEEQDP